MDLEVIHNGTVDEQVGLSEAAILTDGLVGGAEACGDKLYDIDIIDTYIYIYIYATPPPPPPRCLGFA